MNEGTAVLLEPEVDDLCCLLAQVLQQVGKKKVTSNPQEIESHDSLEHVKAKRVRTKTSGHKRRKGRSKRQAQA